VAIVVMALLTSLASGPLMSAMLSRHAAIRFAPAEAARNEPI
jgi:hypothetical protein